MKLSYKHISKKKTAVISLFLILLAAFIFCLPDRLFDVPYSTVVTDRNGELLGARIAGDEQWRFPAGASVPYKFKTCIIEFEDRYFPYHWGVNPLAAGRAAIQNIKNGKIVSGASTITMQVIRLSRNKNRTVWEKIIESILAVHLEFRCSKDEILSLYASHAPFGGNVAGLDAAAWRYYGHAPSQLSWAGAATLAVLPNAPSMLNLSKNRTALLAKRNRLLKKLLDKGIIDEMTFDLALSEELPGAPYPLPQTAAHLVSRFYGTNRGENIASTIDKDIQLRTEAILERWNHEFSQQGIGNLAAIVVDVKTNEVAAYCGNVCNEAGAGCQVDILQAERSTGSILKPFLYAAMLQEGALLPNTLQPDIPLNIGGFSPRNFSLQYTGAAPAAEAVARSLNVPLVYMLKTYGVPKFYNFLRQNQAAALPNAASHYGLSLILGGAEAQPAEISNAYSNMARTLMGLESTRCRLILNEKAQKINTTFEAGAVWQVFEAIKEVNRPEEIDWRVIPGMQRVAWKTGTSYGFRDAWAVGATPKYVVGVWAGNASGEGRPGLTGARTAGPVMFDIFEMLPKSSWFQPPSGAFIEASICRRSGHLAGRFCEDADTALILPAGLRTETCPYHIQATLTADERFRVYENCIGTSEAVQKNWFQLPPAWAWYYKQHNPDYKSLPPFKAGCGGGGGNPMQFIYPQGNTLIYLPKQLDGTRGAAAFELAHADKNAVVYWHIDNEYIAATTDFHKLSVCPEPGRHTVTVVDNDGNTLSCTIDVEAGK